MKDRSLLILIAAVALAFLVNLIFVLTYPINVGQSDNPTYLAMIITGSSNLMHASGYPAIVHVVAHRILPILPDVAIPNGTPSDIGPDWFVKLQRFQLVLHLLLFSTSVFLCARVFGNAVAAIVALGWGCSVLFISNVDATAPEWLQGHAVMLSLLMFGYARKLTGRTKVLVYCLATGVFSFAYLTKYNSLLFASCLLIFIAFDKESWHFKALQVLASAAIFLVLTSAYARFYHHKSTGTNKLSFDQGWVLTAALPSDYLSGPAANLGLNSLRWAALSRVTPPDYFRAGGIETINYGPAADVRQRYVQQFDYAFRMTRPELIQFVEKNPLPQGYSQWSSAVPLYYYYGLEKADALGVDVFLESLQSHSWFHIKKIVESLKSFFIGGLKTVQTFPTFADTLGYKFPSPDFSASRFGTLKIVPPPGSNPYFLQYYNPAQTVSFYGVKIVQWIHAWTSASLVYVVLNIVALTGLFKLRSELSKITAFALLTGLLAVISASGLLLGLRQKELITLTPAYFLLLSIGLVSAGRFWFGVITRPQTAAKVTAPATRRRKR